VDESTDATEDGSDVGETDEADIDADIKSTDEPDEAITGGLEIVKTFVTSVASITGINLVADGLYAPWGPQQGYSTIYYTSDEGGSVSPTYETVTKNQWKGTGSTASPYPGYAFDHWEITDENGYSISPKWVTDNPELIPEMPKSGWPSITIYTAVFKKTQYTLTYKNNHEGNEPDVTVSFGIDASVDVIDNASFAIPFSYEDHEFAGWNTAADGSGVFYAVGTSVSEDLTLYAQWKGKATITYQVNDATYGSVSYSSEELFPSAAEDAAVGSTASPADGYCFVEWQDASGTKVSEDSTFKPVKPEDGWVDATYTAVFALQNKLIYNNNRDGEHNATWGIDSYNGKIETVKSANDFSFSYADHTFTGWNTAANGTGESYDVSASLTMPEEGLTLYAQWSEKEPVTINYQVNDAAYGSVSKSSEEILPDTGEATCTAKPETGYYFVKWQDASGNTVSTDEKLNLTAPAGGWEEGTTYTAVFEEQHTLTVTGKTATVIYDGQEHTLSGYTLSVSGEEIDVDSSGTFMYNSTTYKVEGTEATATGKEAGTYDETFAATSIKITDTATNAIVTKEFNISTKSGKLTIEKRSITIKAGTDEIVYDGEEEHAVGFEIPSVENELSVDSNTFTITASGKSFTVSGVQAAATGLNAGSYTTSVTNDTTKGITIQDTDGNVVTDQFDVAYSTGKLTINPRPIFITSKDAEKDYDGSKLTMETQEENGADGVTVVYGVESDPDSSQATFVGEDAGKITYTFTGYRTLPGKSENTFTYKFSDETTENNYSITTAYGTLKVEKGDWDENIITITPLDIIGYVGGSSMNGGHSPKLRYEVKVTGLPDGVTVDDLDFTIYEAKNVIDEDGNVIDQDVTADELEPVSVASGYCLFPQLTAYMNQQKDANGNDLVTDDVDTVVQRGNYLKLVETSESNKETYSGVYKVQKRMGTFSEWDDWYITATDTSGKVYQVQVTEGATVTILSVSDESAMYESAENYLTPIAGSVDDLEVSNLAVALMEESTVFSTECNKTDLGLIGTDGSTASADIQLLCDDILTTDGKIENAIKAYDSTAEYELKYLDLVNANDGNAQITTNGITIYWPYPDSISLNNASDYDFTMLHFTNYNRSYTVGESLSDVTADYETIKVTPTEYGLAFHTSSFSPFALLWAEKSTSSNVTTSSNTTTSSTTQSSSSSSKHKHRSSSDSTTTSQVSLLPQTDEGSAYLIPGLIPLTGDTNHIILWLILVGASLAAIWALCRSIRRKR
jgi:uncharacterized repeat protein (TIGR02543 family)